MINSTTITDKTTEYLNECLKKHRKPTFKGLGKELHISGHTIANVYKGRYNGKAYGLIPGHRRCIDNKDFETIREVFEEYSMK